MSKKANHRVPSFRHHKSTNQGFVELNGQQIYLGRYDAPETREKYHRVIAEWIANGRQLPPDADNLTVTELVALFWKHVSQHYRRPDGSLTSEVDNYRVALRPVRELYGSAMAGEFGPRSLKTVRQRMIELGWCRNNVNKQIGRVRRMFRWAVENELVPSEVHHGLQAVSGLKRGRSEVKETEPVQPISDETIEITKRQMTPTLAAMVELQRLTGMRPGEVCSMRGCDLETVGKVWAYRPATHKTSYAGRDRIIFIGPRAQRVLRPFLNRDLQAAIFSPAQSEAERRAAMHAKRVTPLSCGNRPGTNRRLAPDRKPGDRYITESYGRAIAYACDKAFPAPDGLEGEALRKWRKSHRWRPNRLRHSFATEIRRQHGLEAAQVLLGHARADVTQVYAEVNDAKARAVALQVG